MKKRQKIFESFLARYSVVKLDLAISRMFRIKYKCFGSIPFHKMLINQEI